MATSTRVELPNGDFARIFPYDASRIRQALQTLQKQGVSISAGSTDLLSSILFQQESAKSILDGFEMKQEDGSFKELSPLERAKLINERPRVTNYLVKRAQELAAATDLEFEEDSKNF